MKNFKVDYNKLYIPVFGKNKEWFEKTELPDGSIKVNVWDKTYSTLELDLRKTYATYGAHYGLFNLTPNVCEKKLLLTLAITRPSERYFKIFAISEKGVFDYSAINYRELNRVLQELIRAFY